MKKRGLTNENPKFKKHSEGSFKDRINPRADVQSSAQAKEMSEKAHKLGNEPKVVKRFRKKKEHIRPGAILPDSIRLNNYIPCSRMSSKECNSLCTLLTGNCVNENGCKAHRSLFKLRKISANLKSILSQVKQITTD